jgi:hypothetical protein
LLELQQQVLGVVLRAQFVIGEGDTAFGGHVLERDPE